MRTAICISGHVRWYKDVLRNFFDMVYKPFKELGEVDIFIHTWIDINGSNNSVSVIRNDTPKSSDRINFGEINYTFNPVDIVVEDYDMIKDNFIVDKFYPDEEVTIWKDIHVSDSNVVQQCIPMFYKWFQCNELKKKYEKLNNFKYDWVMKCRLDVFYFEPIKPLIWDNNYIYNRHGLDDTIFFSSSSNIDIITNIYPNIKKLVEKYNLHCYWEGAADLLSSQLMDNNINRSHFKNLGELAYYLYPRQTFYKSCEYLFQRENRLMDCAKVLFKYSDDLKILYNPLKD